MALDHAYCTVQDVRDQLSDASSRVPDGQLERVVQACSRAVDAWCGRTFWLEETPTASYYRPTDRWRVEVQDIASTTGLAVAGDPSGDGSWTQTWTVQEDFVLEAACGSARNGAAAWDALTAIGSTGFPCSRRRPSLRITALHGWSAVPAQVKEATVLKATSLFKRRDAPFGVATFGEWGAMRITRADPDVMDLLRPFQKVMV